MGTVQGLRHDMRRQVLPRPFAGRVLLVDDVYEDAVLLAAALEPLETSIWVARSAEEALEIVDAHFVDLVVTDLNMPLGASGLDLARELQGRDDVPAMIFVTGSQSAADKVTAFELGAVAYLQKPFDVGHLLQLAREVLLSRCAGRTPDAANDTAQTPPGAR